MRCSFCLFPICCQHLKVKRFPIKRRLLAYPEQWKDLAVPSHVPVSHSAFQGLCPPPLPPTHPIPRVLQAFLPLPRHYWASILMVLWGLLASDCEAGAPGDGRARPLGVCSLLAES